MSGERTKSLLRVAVESGLFPARLTRNIGSYALHKASEVYLGMPAADQPHISERIQEDIVVNEALVGKQFVDIADMTDPSVADSVSEERMLRDKRRGYKLYGHSRIVKALLKADSDPQVPFDVERQVVDIAKESGTDPARLETMLPEIDRERAVRLLEA